MTNLEALKANISAVHGIVLDSNAYLKACLDEEINEVEDYSKANENAIDLATIRLLDKVLETANMSEGNLQYSITNKEHIKNVIDGYLVKWGLAPKYSKVATVSSPKLW